MIPPPTTTTVQVPSTHALSSPPRSRRSDLLILRSPLDQSASRSRLSVTGLGQQHPAPSTSKVNTSKPVPSPRAQGNNGSHVSRLSPRAPAEREEPYNLITVAVVKPLAKPSSSPARR
ncbi:unnamed protein product [Tilletia laevis]|uniref:Uncharacterized protein n=1 Tax=Tilletia laevis TaxID=157183 RepID=A0A9N8M2J5_9BASI|nr:unnamed protein product [Tilletia laevis]